jgi:DNA-binding LacI/PurR family transcriptional regulator
MITLNDIATQAGVSIDTVSRVLNGEIKGRRKDAVARAKKIKRIATELGYRPHSGARTMSRGRFHTVALLLPHDSHGYVPQGMMAGFNRGLEQHQYGLRVDILPNADLADPEFMPRILAELAVDGLLINLLTSVPTGMEELIDRFRIPAVWINDDRSHDCVMPDEHAAMRQAARHLIDFGHRRILLAQGEGGEKAHYSDTARLAGYRSAMKEAGLTPVEDLSGRYGIKSVHREERLAETRAWAERILAHDDHPTAVICPGEQAAEVLAAVAIEHDMRLGRDLSVITFGTNPAVIGGRLSTAMKLHTPGLGSEAVDMLMSKIDQPRKTFARRLYSRTLVIGQTTGPVPETAS